MTAPRVIPKVPIVVIGGGQAGLSSAYHLARAGLRPERDFLLLDHAPGPGGAWQFRWPTLTLSTVNGVHDLPGLGFAETLEKDGTLRASEAVPRYFAAYEQRFELPVHRPVAVTRVEDRGGRLRVETGEGALSVSGVINATGTWEAPYVPDIPGRDRFAGRQLHTVDYERPEAFAGQRVAVVGAGISAVQLLDEISHVTDTLWLTRSPPAFSDKRFTPEEGRAAVAKVEARVREGLPPGSIVSLTGLPLTPALRAARARGVLEAQPMAPEITREGFRWDDGREEAVDVILWCTGFRPVLDHLAPLGLTNAAGGIRMTGRLATQVAADPRLHLVGYGPSASTIGANRAGRAAAQELTAHLGL